MLNYLPASIFRARKETLVVMADQEHQVHPEMQDQLVHLANLAYVQRIARATEEYFLKRVVVVVDLVVVQAVAVLHLVALEERSHPVVLSEVDLCPVVV